MSAHKRVGIVKLAQINVFSSALFLVLILVLDDFPKFFLLPCIQVKKVCLTDGLIILLNPHSILLISNAEFFLKVLSFLTIIIRRKWERVR